MSLRITKVEVNLSLQHNAVIAFANIIFEEEFIVRNLRVVARQDGGRALCMPSRKSNSGEYKDIAHPLTPACRSRIESAVMARVDALLAKAQSETDRAQPQHGQAAAAGA